MNSVLQYVLYVGILVAVAINTMISPAMTAGIAIQYSV